METPSSEYTDSDEKNQIYIIATTIVILMLIATAVYFLTPKTKSIESELETTSPILTEIQKCATPNPNIDCILLYSTPDIEDKCQELEKLKDQCLYNFATINFRFDTCQTITNETLKNKCQEELEKTITSNE